jgi:hypothetical protein
MAAESDGAAPGRRRWPLLAGVGLVAVVAVVVGLLVLRREPEPRVAPVPPTTRVTRVVDRWLAAWERGDTRTMRRLAGGGSGSLTPTVTRFRTDLGGNGPLVAEPGAVSLAPDGRSASVPFGATVRLARGQSWTYRGRIDLAPSTSGDDWRVRWSPAVLHPALTATRRIVAAGVPGARAGVLGADGNPLAVTPSLRSAIVGLRATFEHQLVGDPTLHVRVVEGDRVVEELAQVGGQAPAPVRTTIDPATQAAAEATLATGIPNPKAAAQPAALVAIQVSTGSIRAIASRPAGGFDRALQGKYPPGSTAKVVTSLALLAHGTTAATPISCPKDTAVGGRKFVNAEEETLGAIDFGVAFAHSCNTAFVQLASKLTPAELVGVADELGFNRVPQLGAAAAGSSYPHPGSAADQAAMAIGQGRILVTPLQMAAVASTIAAGAYRRPRLVDDGAPAGAHALAEGTIGTVAALMRRVVTEGTAKDVHFPGGPVSGKTGTAEFGASSPPHSHAWFVGFRGDLAFALVVEDVEGFGGTVAAPLAANFLSRLPG